MGTPKLRKHTSGRFVVRVNGKDIYLGKDRAEAEIQYHQMMLEVARTGIVLKQAPGEELYIAEIIERYVIDREKYCSKNSMEKMRYAIRHLANGFGHFKPRQFGMTELRRLRDGLLKPNDRGHLISRKYVNSNMGEITRFWKWSASMEYCSAEIYSRCATLDPLKRGQSPAPEGKPVRPVSIEDVEKTKAFLNRSVAAMIDLQLLTGARPGEILGLKAEMFDRSGAVWTVELEHHKTAHRDRKRTLYFGEKAQSILKPFLLKRAPGEFLFQPADYYEMRRENAVQPRRDGQPETPRLTERTVGDCYDTDSYRKAITRACTKAGVPHWHPHQLRHTAATEFRKQYGVEAARAMLGHSHVAATEIYAEVDAEVAKKIMGEIG